MTLRALIFDVDGTLADTEECHRQAFNAAFSQHDLPWHWGERSYVELLKITGGKERIAHFIDLLVDTSDAQKAALRALISALHAAKTRLYTEMVAGGRVPLRCGVEDLIAEAVAAGLKLAIASTTTRENIDALISGTLGSKALRQFDAIVTGDQVAHKKPAPDIYRLALHRLGLPAIDCLAFEDSGHGLVAARGAGLCTVVTPTLWTATDDFRTADILLGDLCEVGGLDELRSFHADWRMDRAVAA